MYRVPVQEIRRANNLFGNDNLIHARHFVLIPGFHGPSLSNEPVETEEVEMQKVALKRFQLVSKCVDYKMATIYMESSNWDIELVCLIFSPSVAEIDRSLGCREVQGRFRLGESSSEKGRTTDNTTITTIMTRSNIFSRTHSCSIKN